jgi:hypothetical protein
MNLWTPIYITRNKVPHVIGHSCKKPPHHIAESLLGQRQRISRTPDSRNGGSRESLSVIRLFGCSAIRAGRRPTIVVQLFIGGNENHDLLLLRGTVDVTRLPPVWIDI